MPGRRVQRRPRRRPATGTAGGVPRRPPGGRLVREFQGQTPPADEGEATADAPLAAGAADRPGKPERLVRTCVAGMSDSRAFGPMAAAEAGAGLLRRAPAGVPGGRAAVQLADSTGLFPALRGDRRLPPCPVLPVPGAGRSAPTRRRVGGSSRRGCGMPAGSGGGGAGGVGRLAGALGPCTAGGRRTGPATGGDGRAALFGEQPGADGLPALPAGGLAGDEQLGGVAGGEFNGRVKGRDESGTGRRCGGDSPGARGRAERGRPLDAVLRRASGQPVPPPARPMRKPSRRKKRSRSWPLAGIFRPCRTL